MRRRNQKNRTRIGPHLRQSRTAESQVISVAKIDYVRRSELGELADRLLRLFDGGFVVLCKQWQQRFRQTDEVPLCDVRLISVSIAP
jgi:regulator of replication initiation timing